MLMSLEVALLAGILSGYGALYSRLQPPRKNHGCKRNQEDREAQNHKDDDFAPAFFCQLQ
jgi:hypothetical protein